MAEGFIIANFRHVADGLQEGQFAIGERKRAASLNDLDPIYRQLLDGQSRRRSASSGRTGARA